MIKMLSLPIAWKYDYVPQSSEENKSWRETQEIHFEAKVKGAEDELTKLLGAGWVVLSSHLWDTETDTSIFYVLYLSPKNRSERALLGLD